MVRFRSMVLQVRPGAALLPRLSCQIVHLPLHFLRRGEKKRKAPEGESESERNRLPPLQGQPAATVNEPLQSMSQQSTGSLPSMNMSHLIQPLRPQQKHIIIRNNPCELNGRLLTDSCKMPSKTCPLLVFSRLFFFSVFFFFILCSCLWAETPVGAVCLCLPLRTNLQLHQGCYGKDSVSWGTEQHGAALF